MTTSLNNCVASTIITTISNIYLRKFLGKTRLHLRDNNNNKQLFIVDSKILNLAIYEKILFAN
jgi:hypothetical protein